MRFDMVTCKFKPVGEDEHEWDSWRMRRGRGNTNEAITRIARHIARTYQSLIRLEFLDGETATFYVARINNNPHQLTELLEYVCAASERLEVVEVTAIEELTFLEYADTPNGNYLFGADRDKMLQLFEDTGLPGATTLGTRDQDNRSFRRSMGIEQLRKPAESGCELSNWKSLQIELGNIRKRAEKTNTDLKVPVQYVVTGADTSETETAIGELVTALHQVGTVESLRTVTFDFTRTGNYDCASDSLELSLMLSQGATVVIRMPKDKYGLEKSLGSGGLLDYKPFQRLQHLAAKHRDHLQFIVTFPPGTSEATARVALKKYLPALEHAVVLTSSALDPADLAAFVAEQAALLQVPVDDEVQQTLLSGKRLDRTQITNWLSTRSRQQKLDQQYPEYRGAFGPVSVVDADDDAQTGLERMVGLKNAKRQIKAFVAASELNQERIRRGLPPEPDASLNCIFIGPPGTGKSTGAKYIAALLAHDGALPKGTFLAVNATALLPGPWHPCIADVLEQGRGGVVLIDEFYALSPQQIHELVAEIENYRGDTAVIIAGYPDEIENAIQVNPGIASRFPYQIDFDPYSPTELLEIARRDAEKAGFRYAEAAWAKLEGWLHLRRELPGNARDIHTIFQKSRQQAAARLQGQDLRELPVEVLNTIEPQDLVLDTKEMYDAASSGSSKTGTENAGPNISAWDQLDQMVGLAGIKEHLNELIANVKVQRARANAGLETSPVVMHSTLTGPPGTGKTTTAELVGKICYQEGILPVGNFYALGRSDLVGEYVGATAPKIKKALKKAKGSIVYIDEAYSLLQNDKFSAEAINTLVEQLDLIKDDTIVMFGGYPKEMATFLEANPGLKSRIPHSINFPDYSAGEVLEIVTRMLAREQYVLGDGVTERLQAIIADAVTKPSFGNGRFARNLFEAVKRQLSKRLVAVGLDDVAPETLNQIEAADLANITASSIIGKGANQQRLGFSA